MLSLGDSVNKHSLGTSCVPGSVLGMEGNVVSKADLAPCSTCGQTHAMNDTKACCPSHGPRRAHRGGLLLHVLRGTLPGWAGRVCKAGSITMALFARTPSLRATMGQRTKASLPGHSPSSLGGLHNPHRRCGNFPPPAVRAGGGAWAAFAPVWCALWGFIILYNLCL